VAFWASLAIDWFFEPLVALRVILFSGGMAFFLGILWLRIVQRTRVRMTDGNMATILERRFPQFNDSLLTAVTLSERAAGTEENAKNYDSAMFERTCSQASACASEIRLKDVFNPQPLWRAGIAAILFFLSISLFITTSPHSFATWAERNLQFSNELWPRRTRLLVEGFPGGVRKIARGADLEIVARADLSMPLAPQSVEVRYRTEGGARGRATMDRRGIARPGVDRYQEYTYVFHGALADIHFDVVGGDDRVRDLLIQVVDSPKIIDMSLECTLPAYMKHPPETLPVTGAMQLPMGSRVTVCAKSTKDLVRVHIDSLVDDQPGPSDEVDADQIIDNHRGFRFELEPLMKDATLLFTLTDDDGISNREPVRLALTPIADQPPHVMLQLDGIGAAITPQACLPVKGRVTDDYGIDRIWFEYAVDQQKPQFNAMPVPIDRPTDLPIHSAVLDIQPIGVKPGQKMLVCVKASDLCTLNKEPNIGIGERWLLDVVSPEQLRAMLESRELVLRQQFERQIQEMTDARDLLARLSFDATLDAAKSKAKPANTQSDAEDSNNNDSPKEDNGATAKTSSPSDAASSAEEESGSELSEDSPERQNSLQLLRVQGALSNSRKNVQEIAGIADAVEDIRKQLINNRIDTEELKNRLQAGIIDPLHIVTGQMFPELERRLEKLQAGLQDVDNRIALRDQAQQQVDDIIVAMRKVLDRMIALEDFNEAVELLRAIIQSQKELHQETEQRHKQKIREFLKE
jgi:hypothetical protein